MRALIQSLGKWLHPASAHRRRSESERALQFRAGIVGLVCIVTGFLAIGASLADVFTSGGSTSVLDPAFGSATLEAAVALVAISVFAPQALFRTRNAAYTREVLTNPSSPIRPWRSTTITFDAVLVGALLAGLYFDPALTLAFFGLAFVGRIVFQGRRELRADPNARFHALTTAWAAAATGAAAYLVVRPLSISVWTGGSMVPLLFAALVAMYVGLAMNAVERWVNGDRTRWAFARDAVDTRRIVVALVSAVIAWTVSVVGLWVDRSYGEVAQLAASTAGLGIFLAAWLVLWYVSIRMWNRDAQRTLAMWSNHQAEVVGRLADGSLSAELAARAALPIATRMAVSIFGATRAMTILDDGRAQVVSQLVAVDRFDNGPTPDPKSLVDLPHLRMPLFPVPDHANSSSITVAGWLWPGWFLTRSSKLVHRFTEVAGATLLTPVVASHDDAVAAAFDAMFDRVTRWPTLTAFEEAVDRMRERVDASPQSDSLVIGVYAIDEFGALAGGRFEQAAVAQVVRIALGNRDFAGHDVFVAYEDPGRVWVALGGGPMIRTSIGLLRDLQEQINERGAVPSTRMDVDVHVSVSFGHATHQVDDFSLDGLMDTARERLTADQGVRDPFHIDGLMTYDISPEDIIGAGAQPVTAVDLVDLLHADRTGGDAMRGSTVPFVVHLQPIIDLDDDGPQAIVLTLGWHRAFGTLDLTQPDVFRSLVNRQMALAAEAARMTVEQVRRLQAQTTTLGRPNLPVVAWFPSILLHADAGEFALPNLVAGALDRAACARTVVLIDAVPQGAGQALRLLADRGVSIAVTAGAAAAADPADLQGWQRWAILLPNHVVQGPSGVDGLTIQQTASAIATHDTHLVAIGDDRLDTRALAEHNVHWALDNAEGSAELREVLGVRSR